MCPGQLRPEAGNFFMRNVIAALAVAGVGVWWIGLADAPVRASVSRGSTSGYRAADHNQYGVNNEYGMVNFSIEHVGASHVGQGDTVHRLVREAGVGWVRYWLSWEIVQSTSDPNPANWNWAQADYDIDTAVAQGLNVYVTIQGAPAWAHDGKPSYSWLHCYTQANGIDGFDNSRPGCGAAGTAHAVAPFDPAGGNQSANWKHFVREAVRRYSDRVKHWGFWNEPNEKHFWPENSEATCGGRLLSLVDKVIQPAREAALSVNPGIVIVGPDEYHPDAVEHFLRIEHDGLPACGRPPTGRLFDVLSLHAYNIGANGGALASIHTKMAPYFRREVWLTETNGGSGMTQALMHYERNGWISKIFLGGMRAQGPCGILNLLNDAKEPCHGYDTLRAHIVANPPAMHFAGTTGAAGHHDFVLLQNPHVYPTKATVLYSTAAGTTNSTTYDLPPTSRTTLHVPTEGRHGAVDQGVSVIPASASLPVWAEHADYWNNFEAGRNSQGTGERSDKWYFAEGVVGGTYWAHDNVAYNPNTQPIRVTWDFLNASGSIATRSEVLNPRGHYRLRVNTVPRIEGEHSTLVSAVWEGGDAHGKPAPVVAERIIAWNNDIEGHSTRGVPFPSLTWYFGEGSQGGPWSTYLLLMNPSTQSAMVEVRYMQESGLSEAYHYRVAPRRRFTIAPPIQGAFGILVRSIAFPATPSGPAVPVAVPIVAERAMYFGDGWPIGHATEGATSPSQRWMFPEGSTEGGYVPFFLLANPSPVDARVRLEFGFLDGSTHTETVTVLAGRRLTFNPRDYQATTGKAFSTEIIVESTQPGVPPPGIVAERAMYWLGPFGLIGAHATLGMP
jgi:hypothetical protein